MARRRRFSRGRSMTGEQGYILLALLLVASLLLIAAAAMAPRVAQQIQRDREEELIHRGMQYRRAIRAFAKRTGRYPSRLEELEYTNGTRFLRKQYKDPMTGGEFRLLYARDIQATGSKLKPSSPPDQNSNGTSGGTNSAAVPANSAVVAGSGDASSSGENAPAAAEAAPAPPAAATPQPTGDPAPVKYVPMRGGLIFGVASTSEKKTIREFENKSHYNQWLFFYSSIYDGSFEVKGPTPMNPVFPKVSPDSSQSGQPSP